MSHDLDPEAEIGQLKSRVWQAALAGLLHDIGKFSQRADVGKRETTDQQSLSQVKYEHALHSDSFVQQVLPAEWRGQITAPRQHHNPQSDQDHQVQLADWLSSGEREQDEDNRVPYLLSSFARLAGHAASAYVPLSRLERVNASIFPTQGEPGNWRDQYRDQYQALWEEFVRECRRLPKDNLTTYLDSLYGLMQEFTWCIPSADTNSTPDVSLFDHARTTAALAACLAADGRDSQWCQRVTGSLKSGNATDKVCLLVGGDISGVQTFLYTLTSSGAAKSLRARSFYLQLLTEVVAQYVLDQLGLPITNLLYAGGGNFILIAGVTHEDELKRIRREVSTHLLAAHDGALHLALGAVPVQAIEFTIGRFHTAWNRLHQQLNIDKRRPMADLDPARLAEEIGSAAGEGGDTERVCSVCGREGRRALSADDRDDDLRKCDFCASLETLGQQLSHATHLVWLKSAPVPPDGQESAAWWKTMMAFGVNVFAVDADDAPGKDGYIDYWPGQLELIRVNPLKKEARYSAALLKELARGVPVIQTNRLFAQLVPMEGKQVMTFDGLAKHSRGVRRWGVLRMDVDNLGELFRQGFMRGQDNALTLSRVASLSFALRLFFEGWLPALGRMSWPHEGEDPAGGRIRDNTLYIQYAGGDDVFVVGAWDVLPEFAARIRESFRQYTGHNPSVTLSGGLILADQRFPLYEAAGQAEEAERAAKNYGRAGGRDKDALHVLGQTIGWEHYPEVSRRAQLMAGWCDGSGHHGVPLPKSIIQSFLAMDADFQRGAEENRAYSKNRRKGAFYYGPWVWHAVYKLTRTIASLRDARDVAETLEQWEEELLKPDTQSITTMGLAARWAELLTRKESGE